ncbi:hypothetical protein Tco_1479662, partial [Tanacetum coccineum]
MMSSFFQMQSLSGSASLLSNTIANPRGDLKAITTRNGVSYDGPTILPTSSPLLKEVEFPIPEPNVAPKPNPKPSIPYPLRLNDQNLHEKANNQMLKFLQIFQRLHFELSFADALLHMPKFASTFKSLLCNKETLFELANTPLNENCLAVLLKKLPKKLGDPGKFLIPCDFSELDECLALADIDASINLMLLSVWKKLSSYHYYFFPSLTPFEGGDLILEEIEACLTSDLIPPGIDDADFDLEGDILLLEKLLNDDPSSPLPPKELNFEELKTIKYSIDDPPKLELKDLNSHLEYAFLEGTNKLRVIIAKNLKDDEKGRLLK